MERSDKAGGDCWALKFTPELPCNQFQCAELRWTLLNCSQCASLKTLIPAIDWSLVLRHNVILNFPIPTLISRYSVSSFEFKVICLLLKRMPLPNLHRSRSRSTFQSSFAGRSLQWSQLSLITRALNMDQIPNTRYQIPANTNNLQDEQNFR